jgi:multicomponent Na+:H+ antiporter subunit D
MSFASYGLVVHNGDADALRAGRIYIYLVVIGEVMLFAAFVMQSQAAGSLLIPDFSNARPSAVAVGLILVGFGIKAGALPLHVWLPLAHPAAPTPASAVLSGAMIKAGLLGWLRFLPIGSAGLPQWGSLCIVAGLLAAYYAVAVGLPQQNPKTVLAYSSISQMGLMTVGVGLALGWPQTVPIVVPAVTIYAAHHCFAKGALFLGVGVASNAAKLKPVVAGLILASLALAGAPLTSGAVAKVALKLPLKEMHEFWVAGLTLLLTLAAMGTTLLMARFLFVVTRPAEGHGRPQPIVWVSWAVSVLLTAVAVWLLPSARGAAGIALQPASLWQALWPVAAGLLAAGGLWFAAFRKHWHPAFHIPEGDLLAVVAALGRGCLRRGRRQSERVRQAVSRVLQIFQEARPAPERFQRLAARMEARLVSWQTAGLVFIGLLGCLLFLSLTG